MDLYIMVGALVLCMVVAVRRHDAFAHISQMVVKTDFSWKRPRPVLVLDRDGAEFIVQALGPIQSYVVPMRNEAYIAPPNMVAAIIKDTLTRFTIKILTSIKPGLRAAKNGKSQRKTYPEYVIEALKPKVVITFTDNFLGFYQISALYPDMTFLAIQNGWRFPEEVVPHPGRKATWLFCLGRYDKDMFVDAGHDPAKVIIAGSLRECLSRSDRDQDPRPVADLCLVSQWRAGFFATPSISAAFRDGNNVLAECASRYAKERGLTVRIASVNCDDEEVKYFQRYFGDGIYISSKLNGPSVYSVMRSTRLVLSMVSTTGREALGMGIRTLFFGIPSLYEVAKGKNDLDEVFIMELDYESFRDRVDSIRSIDDDEWRSRNSGFSDFHAALGGIDFCHELRSLVGQAVSKSDARP